MGDRTEQNRTEEEADQTTSSRPNSKTQYLLRGSTEWFQMARPICFSFHNHPPYRTSQLRRILLRNEIVRRDTKAIPNEQNDPSYERTNKRG
mgnify:FL=1|jgi:hypothetical protein